MHNCMFRNQSSGHAQVIFMLRVLVSEQGLKEGKSDFIQRIQMIHVH
jgi:hypothetical protein